MIKYVPILRGKDGEFAALQNLDEAALSQICPLVQFLPDTNINRKGDYIKKVTSNLVNAWNFDGNLMYFDVSYLADINIITNLANILKGNDINIIPVLDPNSNEKYLELIPHGFLDKGVCIRIKRACATPRTLRNTIDATLMRYNIKSSEIDLLIDLEYIDDLNDLPVFQNTFLRLFESIKNPEDYRRIIIGDGSFPIDVAAFPPDKITSIPRIEWYFWRSVNKELDGFPIIYADYGNIHPKYDPYAQAFEGSCTIKYSSDRGFHIFRGKKASGHPDGGRQYHQKSRELIDSKFYDGKDFSWGDENIFKCANEEITPGNSGTWVKYTFNHHFMKIISLLG